MRVVYQTTVNLVRQKTQAIVKQALERVGIEVELKAHNWTGGNLVRWVNAEYDRLWKQAATELDPIKRTALFIRTNDLVIEDVVVIPVVWRHSVSAGSYGLRGMELGPWDRYLWNLAYWYRET